VPASEPISIVVPARNEATGLKRLLPEIRKCQPDASIIVVDDGSEDDTARVAVDNGAMVISHPYPMGNGAAVKTGVRAVNSGTVVCLDGDGQHQAADVASLLEKLDTGFDMVVGARESSSHASLARRLANGFYNRLSSWIVGQNVQDLTSGFRAARVEKFRKFLHLLPNGFSYPTTITMAFFRAGFPVSYVPVTAQPREGKSHISPLKDGVRFLLIIFRVGVLYSPLKVFFPISLSFFLLGLGYYIYTYVTAGRFTNMSALLFITCVLVFLIGLVSEQITMLLYRDRDEG
jgi:glycosyltransferase involved in cell wall biosynthesis